MLWSDTYNMYIQPQYEGNWVDGNNPFGQFVHYYMAFEPTEELKVYTIVGAKSDVLKTEWTATLEVPEANGESLDRDDVVAQLFNDNAIGCAEAKGGNQCAVPFIEFVCTTTCGGTYEAADFERDQDSLTVGQFGMRCPCGATVESCKSAAIALACPESCAAAIAGEELDQQEQDACEDDVRKAKEAAAKAAADALANADNNGFDRNDIIGKLFNDPAVGCAAVKANGQCANPFLTYICSTTCGGEATEDDFKKDSPLTLAQYGMTCCQGATSDSCVDAAIAFVCPQSCSAATKGEEVAASVTAACDALVSSDDDDDNTSTTTEAPDSTSAAAPVGDGSGEGGDDSGAGAVSILSVAAVVAIAGALF